MRKHGMKDSEKKKAAFTEGVRLAITSNEKDTQLRSGSGAFKGMARLKIFAAAAGWAIRCRVVSG